MTAYLPSKSFAGDTPASRSASQAASAEKTTRATSGRKCLDSYESYGLDGSFARTLLATLNSASTPYSMTWQLRATPQRRWLFQLAASGRLIGGNAYGLLPTPLACGGRIIGGRRSDSLLTNYLPNRFGGNYPHPSLLEAMMGFPTGWTEVELSETP